MEARLEFGRIGRMNLVYTPLPGIVTVSDLCFCVIMLLGCSIKAFFNDGHTICLKCKEGLAYQRPLILYGAVCLHC